MAAKETPAAAPAGEAPKKGKKLLMIVLAVTILVVALLAAVILMLSSSHNGGDDDDDEDEVQQTPKVRKKSHEPAALPIYVPLKFSGDRDTFTVNLAPDEGSTSGPFIQIGISLKVDDLEADATLKAWMPEILNDINFIVSSKKESEVMTKEGKEALALEIRDGINTVVSAPVRKGKTPDGPVQAVLFTAFIIQ